MSLSNIFLLALLLKASLAFSIVSGDKIPGTSDEGREHPGRVNTVALLTMNLNRPRIFCSASIIGRDLILTAKHCIKSKEQGRIKVYFGSSQVQFDPSLVRDVVEVGTFGSDQWMDYFPNGDVAWVRIHGEIPNLDGKSAHLPKFQALEILRDIRNLPMNSEITIVGYGNSVASASVINAGEKLKAEVILQEYLHNTHFYHLILLQGQNGQGACHGDSGGPAYAKLWDPTNQRYKWYIIGVTNGFDVSLTPNSLRLTGDPDFPLYAHCDKGESVYSFVGPYTSWIEDSAQTVLLKSSWNVSAPFEEIPEGNINDDFYSWCENTKLADSSWLTIKQLMLWAIDEAESPQAQKELFLNCEKSSRIVNTFSELKFGPKEIFGTLDPLVGLHNVKSVEFRSVDFSSIDIESLAKMSNLETIRLIDVNLEDISKIEVLANLPNLKTLDLSKNHISSFKGLSSFSGLEEISLDHNNLSNLADLSVWLGRHKVKKLNLASNKIKNVASLSLPNSLEWLSLAGNPIEALPLMSRFQKLQYFDISYTSIENIDELTALSKFNHLETLRLNKLNINSADPLRNLLSLRRLEMSNCYIESIDFIARLVDLRRFKISQCEVSDISVFSRSNFPHLEELNLALNRITTRQPLSRLSVKKLWMGGNPL